MSTVRLSAVSEGWKSFCIRPLRLATEDMDREFENLTSKLKSEYTQRPPCINHRTKSGSPDRIIADLAPILPNSIIRPPLVINAIRRRHLVHKGSAWPALIPGRPAAPRCAARSSHQRAAPRVEVTAATWMGTPSQPNSFFVSDSLVRVALTKLHKINGLVKFDGSLRISRRKYLVLVKRFCRTNESLRDSVREGHDWRQHKAPGRKTWWFWS